MIKASRLWLYLGVLFIAAQCSLPPLGSISGSTSTIKDSASERPAAAPVEEAAKLQPDLLDVVQERGYLKVAVRVWPDSSFSPPLFRNAFGALDGYEVELAWAIANNLGLGLEMAESDPQQIANGGWDGEWDIALAWLPITDKARQVLIFSEAYAYDSGGLVVHNANESIAGLDDLAGKRVGVPAHSIYQQVLSGQAPSLRGAYIGGTIPPNIEIISYNQDGKAFRDLAEGDGAALDAVVHSELAFNQTLRAEFPLKMVESKLFPVPIGLAFDRSGIPSERLRQAVNNILIAKRQDGSLAELAIRWYEQDILPPRSGY